MTNEITMKDFNAAKRAVQENNKLFGVRKADVKTDYNSANNTLTISFASGWYPSDDEQVLTTLVQCIVNIKRLFKHKFEVVFAGMELI